MPDTTVGTERRRTRETSPAAAAAATAITANTSPGPLTRSNPAHAGPTKEPIWVRTPSATLAAVRSAALEEMLGSSVPIAGRVNVTATDTMVEAAYTSSAGAAAAMAMAVAAIAAACTAYPTRSTRSMRKRSPAAAANGATTAAGSSWTAATTPASVTPPRWNV